MATEDESTHLRGAPQHYSKRRRRYASVPSGRAQYYDASSSTTTGSERRLLQQAMQNSKLDKGRPADGRLRVPAGPVFFPTVEEFVKGPVAYVEQIRPIAERYGVCKIVPPAGWNMDCHVDHRSPLTFPTKHQLLHRLQEGVGFDDGIRHSISSYQMAASRHATDWKKRCYPNHDLFSRNDNSSKSNEDLPSCSTTANPEVSSSVSVDTIPGPDDSDELKSEVVESQHSSSTSTGNPSQKHTVLDQCFTVENLERDYWNVVEAHWKEVAVDYGNDVDTEKYGSGFPLSERGRAIKGTKNISKTKEPEPEFGTAEFYRETWWNLCNTASAPGSVLRYFRVGINGINVPWMYYGSLFSTFCWHNEDNYLYSINYHHKGAPKVWYGVPGTKKGADGLEKVFKNYLSMKMRDVPDLLHHITTMFSPRLLQNANVPVYRLVQHEGEFVITFPLAFHGGFSLGPNVGEAVNFATHDWISHGADANERYRSFARPAVFSHDRLTFTMAYHLADQQSSSTCERLLTELERIVKEELTLRRQLRISGVRDVSDVISLPKNRLDQLDEESADYDDKRLCHACKHICFFSAVACECSQRKVSCLRHSQFMCRCMPERRYFLLWSDDEELTSTLERVRTHYAMLQEKDMNGGNDIAEGVLPMIDNSDTVNVPLPTVAPGAQRDRALHRFDEISTAPFWAVRQPSSRPHVDDDQNFIADDDSACEVIDLDGYGKDAGESDVKPPSPSPLVLDESAFAKAERTEAEDEVQVIDVRGPSA